MSEWAIVYSKWGKVAPTNRLIRNRWWLRATFVAWNAGGINGWICLRLSSTILWGGGVPPGVLEWLLMIRLKQSRKCVQEGEEASMTSGSRKRKALDMWETAATVNKEPACFPSLPYGWEWSLSWLQQGIVGGEEGGRLIKERCTRWSLFRSVFHAACKERRGGGDEGERMESGDEGRMADSCAHLCTPAVMDYLKEGMERSLAAGTGCWLHQIAFSIIH